MTSIEDVTVITPSLPERDNFLEDCVESVELQTVGAPRHIIGLDEHHEGPAKVRNFLANFAQTEWLLFLDDDDLLDLNYFEKVLPALTANSDVVYTWCRRIGFRANLDFDFDAEHLRRENYIPVTACVRTSMFTDVGGFPTAVGYEDWGLWTRILDKGGKFRVIKDKLWTYRRHGGSRTHQNQREVASGRIPAR